VYFVRVHDQKGRGKREGSVLRHGVKFFVFLTEGEGGKRKKKTTASVASLVLKKKGVPAGEERQRHSVPEGKKEEGRW